jgi:hypothetical protein
VLIDRVDAFRFKNRFTTRVEAIRWLTAYALQQKPRAEANEMTIDERLDALAQSLEQSLSMHTDNERLMADMRKAHEDNERWLVLLTKLVWRSSALESWRLYPLQPAVSPSRRMAAGIGGRFNRCYCFSRTSKIRNFSPFSLTPWTAFVIVLPSLESSERTVTITFPFCFTVRHFDNQLPSLRPPSLGFRLAPE